MSLASIKHLAALKALSSKDALIFAHLSTSNISTNRTYITNLVDLIGMGLVEELIFINYAYTFEHFEQSTGTFIWGARYGDAEAIRLHGGFRAMGSTTDKIVGKANELAGKARQSIGEAVGNEEMQAKGLAQEAKGDAQQAKGEVKGAIKNVVDKA